MRVANYHFRGEVDEIADAGGGHISLSFFQNDFEKQ